MLLCSVLSVIIFLCWTQSHFHSFYSPCSATRLLELCQVFWPVTEWKVTRQLPQHSGPKKLTEKGTKIYGGQVSRNKTEELFFFSKFFFFFSVTAVPYCPQKMSLYPWEATLRGDTHLSNHIYWDVLWLDLEEPFRRPTALFLTAPTAHIVSPQKLTCFLAKHYFEK